MSGLDDHDIVFPQKKITSNCITGSSDPLYVEVVTFF